MVRRRTPLRAHPAYTRFVNRRLGRLLAAWAYRRGLSPNAVTGISAAFTSTAVVLLAALAPSWSLGWLARLLLVLGYAWDSADGQVARLTGTGSSAGEWLDHMVGATEVVSLPLALLLGTHHAGLPDAWLLVPLANAVVGSVLFFDHPHRAAPPSARGPVDRRDGWAHRGCAPAGRVCCRSG